MSRKKFRYKNLQPPLPAARQPKRSPLRLGPDVCGGLYPGAPATADQIRQYYGPAQTLGANEETRLAMDAQLEADGVYSLLQHTLALGQGAAPQFMGYGALQNIAQNGLIRACIETVADDMTRSWIELKDNTGAASDDIPYGEDDFLKKLEEAQDKLALQKVFHEASELVGYDGGAFVFIDTGATGNALEYPLHLGKYSSEIGPGTPLRFTVIDPVNVFPGDYNSLSPLRPDYFRPGWWWVLGEKVHASRLIRLVANEVPVLLRPSYNFLGIPQAQILWDYVLHFQECRAAEARLLTKFSLTVFKTNLSDVLFASGGTAELDARIRFMIQSMSNDGVLAVDKETEDVVKLETPISGVTDIVRQALEFLAALNRTPAVKLLGVSPSGFNATGESDIRNYYDHIKSQQEKVLRDGIGKALQCVQLHLEGNLDRKIDFEFAALGEEDRTAIVNQQKTRADTIAVYLDRGVIDQEEARKALANDPDGGFADIDPGEVPEDDMADEGMPGMTGSMLPGAQDANEEGEWITTSQGKHIEIDPENGEILKGNVGQKDFSNESEVLESTSPDMARYNELLKQQDGNHKKAAREYFKEKLQGRHVEAQTDKGPIQATFTGNGWNEIKKGMHKDTLKAELVPHLPDIIATGSYTKESPQHEHPDVSYFHTYTKFVQTTDGPKRVIVDVAERAEKQPKNTVYSVNREGTPAYEKRQKKSASSPVAPGQYRGTRKLPTQDSNAAIEERIIPQYEVVNIRFAEEA